MQLNEREKTDENTSDIWIYHLDDESMITKQGLLSILDHIDNNREPISEGLIIYPNKIDFGSRVVKYLDAVRPTFCYTCCSMLNSKGKPDWLHGSNLLIRADIEKSVGWDFPIPVQKTVCLVTLHTRNMAQFLVGTVEFSKNNHPLHSQISLSNVKDG